jgi:uncharacterized membrane protein
MTEVKTIPAKPRLKFIDMARTIAILLMLEGHFVDDSLALIYRDPDNAIFSTWLYIRGFTAATFLTVTGLIFVYLLLKNQEAGYFQNIRIRKGFKRVIELFFWGFVVQYYAFHVLECIAMGILTILVIYGLYKLIKVIPLWIYFLVAGIAVFYTYNYIRVLPDDVYWPHGAPKFIQNAFHGPRNSSIFPVVPWLGFTMFGAMIGALLHDLNKIVHRWYFPLFFFLFGGLSFFFPKDILFGIDRLMIALFDFKTQFVYIDWIFLKLGMVIMILGGLIIIDQRFGKYISDKSLFIKVGQNTLTIYVLHMMVLYGSLIGIGVNDFYHKKLGPWEVTIGAILFLSFFIILIKYIDQIRKALEFILKPIRRTMNKIFGTSPTT